MKNILKLTGKKYIVTGASSGIGRETCKYLARLGATVILVARNEMRLKECIGELEGEGHRYYMFDFNQVTDIENFMKKIVEENGKLDGLVHSAGVTDIMPIKNTTYQKAMGMMQPNLFSFLEILRVFSSRKYNAGSGAVVGISSYAVASGAEGQAGYAVSKAGIELLTRVAAKELCEKRIRVNCVQPGWVKTKSLDRYFEEFSINEKEMAGTKNALEPIEVASVIAFLLSDISSGVNGAIIPIMGKLLWK